MEEIFTEALTGFNSSLVRLGAQTPQLGNFIGLFQFQLGAIGSPDAIVLISSIFPSFNSSLVRLGGYSAFRVANLSPRFNSSLVRLGVFAKALMRLFLISFNSSLVRLGELICR